MGVPWPGVVQASSPGEGMASADGNLARRVLELFPLLVEAGRDEQLRLLSAESAPVRARLEKMLQVETLGLTTQAQAAVTAELSPPHRVGDFRILAPLGAGGMGLVFLAEQGSPRRRVAVKLLRPVHFTDEARRAFLAEVERLAQLSGGGLPFLIAAGVEGGWPWLAMEWVRGERLDVWAESAGTAERLQALVTLARIVDRAHARGVAHLDLKPANVLVGPGGVTLLDLGIAQVAGAVGLGAGTAGWRAPEQIAGEPVDVRSDVYALGRLGLHLLGPSGPWAPVLARATAGDPAERYPRARDFATALEEAEGRVELAAESPGVFLRRVALAVQDDPGNAQRMVSWVERAMEGRDGLSPVLAKLAQALDEGVIREEPEAELRLRILLAEACLAVDGDLAGRQAEAALGLLPLVDDPVAGPRAHMAQAEALRLAGRLEESERALQRADAELPREDPLRARLAYLRGALALDRGRTEEAVELLARAMAVPAPSRAASTRYVHALSLCGRLQEARTAAHALLARERARFDGAPHLGLAAAHGTCAVAHGELGETTDALEHARAEVEITEAELGPDAEATLQACCRLAMAAVVCGDAHTAIAAGRRAARGESPRSLLILATALRAGGRLEEAIEAGERGLQRVLSLDPGSKLVPMYQGTLAELLVQADRPDEALAHLHAALPILRGWTTGGTTHAQIQRLDALCRQLEARHDG